MNCECMCARTVTQVEVDCIRAGHNFPTDPGITLSIIVVVLQFTLTRCHQDWCSCLNCVSVCVFREGNVVKSTLGIPAANGKRPELIDLNSVCVTYRKMKWLCDYHGVRFYFFYQGCDCFNSLFGDVNLIILITSVLEFQLYLLE